jgi:hypothetical protein
VRAVKVEEVNDFVCLFFGFIRELVIWFEIDLPFNFPTHRFDVKFLDKPAVVIQAKGARAVDDYPREQKQSRIQMDPA